MLFVVDPCCLSFVCCLLFVVSLFCRWLQVSFVRCCLCVARCLWLFDVRRWLFCCVPRHACSVLVLVVCHVLLWLIVRCVLFVVRYVLFVVCW